MMMVKFNAWTVVIPFLTSKFFISDGSNRHKSNTELKVCEDKIDGYHTYHGDCEKYIWCLNKKGYVLRCVSGLHYSATEKVCTFPHSAHCPWLKTANNSLYNVRKFRSSFYFARTCERIVCYYWEPSKHREGKGKFTPRDIDTSLCTHIIYDQALVENSTLVLSEQRHGNRISQIMEGKQHNPSLEVLLEVGVLRDGPFSEMVATFENREKFIKSAMKVLKQYEFDGLNIYWRYPTRDETSTKEEKQLFVSLVQEMRTVFNYDHSMGAKRRMLITASVSPTKHVIDSAYDVPGLAKYLDFINLLSWFYHTSKTRTGHSSLISGVKRSAEYWVEKGFPSTKILIGLPFFGYSFTLLSKYNAGYGAPSRKGLGGKYTRMPGILSYYEICALFQSKGSSKHLHNVFNPYIVNGNRWVSYDDRDSMWMKVQYVLAGDFGGVMLWDVSLDDYNGTFCGFWKYPLLKMVNRACKG